MLRGLHYQLPPKAQGKLIRAIQGEIIDVVVDIRKDSPTFGQWLGEVLSAENKKQIWIPHGFAHGYEVISDEAEVLYKCDEVWYPKYERGIIWNDDILDINWKSKNPIVSEKDKKLPGFKDVLRYES